MPGERKPGQDHGHYDWSPITTRPVLRWPDNARVALCAIVNLEHFDWQLPPDVPEPVSPVSGAMGLGGIGAGPGRFPNLAGYSQHEYGNRVGVFRVLRVLDKYGITPTVAMDQTVAENYRFLVNECQERDAEFIAHGASVRRIIHTGMSEEEERQYIHDSIEALEKATGKRPVGWASPELQESLNTPALLAAEGIRYVCDWANDEQPYRMNVPEGELFSLSIDLDLDDIFIHLNGRRLIGEYGQIIRDTFDGLYKDGAKSGLMMVINIHPWVIGQPWRIRYLDEALAHINRYGAVWKATAGEIVDSYAAQT
jgi:peptidoglycan/xylan/chitin deacetylase (PgdA/CDA1 family)